MWQTYIHEYISPRSNDSVFANTVFPDFMEYNYRFEDWLYFLPDFLICFRFLQYCCRALYISYPGEPLPFLITISKAVVSTWLCIRITWGALTTYWCPDPISRDSDSIIMRWGQESVDFECLQVVPEQPGAEPLFSFFGKEANGLSIFWRHPFGSPLSLRNSTTPPPALLWPWPIPLPASAWNSHLVSFPGQCYYLCHWARWRGEVGRHPWCFYWPAP